MTTLNNIKKEIKYQRPGPRRRLGWKPLYLEQKNSLIFEGREKYVDGAGMGPGPSLPNQI
jgi:hypothetical protein